MKYNRQLFCSLSDKAKNKIVEEELSLETHNGTTKDDLLMLLEWAYSQKNNQDLESNEGWVLIDDRLPNESGYYRVTIKSTKSGVVSEETAWFAHTDDYDMDESGWRELYEDEEVVAWRELSPYRPERRQNEARRD